MIISTNILTSIRVSKYDIYFCGSQDSKGCREVYHGEYYAFLIQFFLLG